MKWLTSLALLAFCIWIMFAFQGCGENKLACHNGWKMPDGVVCAHKESAGLCGTFRFSNCDGGREYNGPMWFESLEVCR